MYLGTQILDAVPPSHPPGARPMPVASAVSNGKKTSHHDGGRREGTQLPICTTYRAHAGRRIASRSLLLPVLGWSPPKAVGSPRSRQGKISCGLSRALQLIVDVC